MIVWSYVITVDAGSAPNLELPLATLAICKPKIRIAARPGDMVLAFNGSSLNPEPHSVRWAGVISESLTFKEYWNDSRFEGKKPDRSSTPDNIYRPTPSGMQQEPNPAHCPSDAARDLRGENVLMFESYWYFGPTAPILPDKFGLRLNGGRRGHRQVSLSGDLERELKHWLTKQTPAPPSGPRHTGQAGTKTKCN